MVTTSYPSLNIYSPAQGLPRWLSGKESACQCRRCRKHWFNPWVREMPWSRKWQPMPVFLPGKFHGQRHLAGYSPWGCQESDTTEHVCSSSSPGTLGPEALSAGPQLEDVDLLGLRVSLGPQPLSPDSPSQRGEGLEASDRQWKPCVFSCPGLLCPNTLSYLLPTPAPVCHLLAAAHLPMSPNPSILPLALLGEVLGFFMICFLTVSCLACGILVP